MNKRWLSFILVTAIFLIATLKSHQVSSLKPYFKAERSIRLSHFDQAKKQLTGDRLELLELWESILTGRSAPVNSWMKDQYRSLALNHLFTPSGFHLSAVLLPVQWLVKARSVKLLLFILIGAGLLLLPGMGALKRMLSVKTAQLLSDQKVGFLIAMVLDLLIGHFAHSPLSFSYSFLFLGIIYSGLKGASLILWFFLAQLLLAYFQASLVSPLLLLFSPVLNLLFGMAMPALFLLAFPLWDWQLNTGLLLLKILQWLVHISSTATQLLPLWEVNIGLLLFVLLFLLREFRWCVLALILFCQNLNIDHQREPSLGTHEFYPQGRIVKVIAKSEEDLIYFEDGKCRRKLVRGMWWENCSPRKRSSSKKLMKLSYPSSEQRKSSLRG